MEKADSLIKSNKDLEKRLEYLSVELTELKKERKHSQEAFSQKFIVLQSQIEQLREDKESHKMQLESKLRMNKAYSTLDLKQINRHGEEMIKVNAKVTAKLKTNELFREDSDPDKLNDEMDVIREQVQKESELKFQRLYALQVKAQEKEK